MAERTGRDQMSIEETIEKLREFAAVPVETDQEHSARMSRMVDEVVDDLERELGPAPGARELAHLMHGCALTDDEEGFQAAYEGLSALMDEQDRAYVTKHRQGR
jgi:hypothetical protein